MINVDVKNNYNVLQINTLKNFFDEKTLLKLKTDFPILNSKNVNQWLIDLVSKYTSNGKDSKKFLIDRYLYTLNGYCEFYHINPDELLLEDLDTRNQRLKQYLNHQIQTLHKNPVTISNDTQSKLKSYYAHRGSPITFQKECYKAGENKNEINLDNEIIRKIEAQLHSTQYRLVLKFESQTGFRISDILTELTSGKYHFEKYQNHYYIKNFETQKEKTIINYVFITKELEDIIKSMSDIQDLTLFDLSTLFKVRYRCNEDGTEFQRKIWVQIEKEDETKKIERTYSSEKKIDKSNYLRRIKTIVSQIGITQNIKTHSFRKYFRTMVSRAELGTEFTEHLCGHKLTNLADAYNRDLQNIDQYYKKWLKIEPLLSIDYVVVNKTDEEVVKQKEALERMKLQLELEIKSKFELEEKLKRLEQKFDTAMHFINKDYAVSEYIDENGTHKIDDNEKSKKKKDMAFSMKDLILF